MASRKQIAPTEDPEKEAAKGNQLPDSRNISDQDQSVKHHFGLSRR